MSIPGNLGRRKVRIVRPGETADDLVVVLRAAPVDRRRALRNLTDDASDSAATYVVINRGGDRELLFGISVFAMRPGRSVGDTLIHFRNSPSYMRLTIGHLRHAGFEVWPTGVNPDHYDVQLVSGYGEGLADATPDELREAAARLLWTAGDLIPNPDYPGGSEHNRQ